MTPQHKKNLLKLADILDSFDKESEKLGIDEFNMYHWARRSVDTDGLYRTTQEACELGLDTVQVGEFCNTSACALGTAALHPYFNKQGLGVKFDKSGAGIITLNTKGVRFIDSAISKIFGIPRQELAQSFSDGHELFYGGQVTPKQKATEIRKYVKDHS